MDPFSTSLAKILSLSEHLPKEKLKARRRREKIDLCEAIFQGFVQYAPCEACNLKTAAGGKNLALWPKNSSKFLEGSRVNCGLKKR